MHISPTIFLRTAVRLVIVALCIVLSAGCSKNGNTPPAPVPPTLQQKLAQLGKLTVIYIQLTDQNGQQVLVPMSDASWISANVLVNNVTFKSDGTATEPAFSQGLTWTITPAGSAYDMTFGFNGDSGKDFSATAFIGHASVSANPNATDVSLAISGSWSYQSHTYNTMAEVLEGN